MARKAYTWGGEHILSLKHESFLRFDASEKPRAGHDGEDQRLGRRFVVQLARVLGVISADSQNLAGKQRRNKQPRQKTRLMKMRRRDLRLCRLSTRRVRQGNQRF